MKKKDLQISERLYMIGMNIYNKEMIMQTHNFNCKYNSVLILYLFPLV